MEAAGEAISKMEVHDWNRDKIDREVRVPIYRQLKEIIKSKIEKGDFKPGTRIPTEYELCEIYDISRISVRQALTELANEGLLYRRPGQGTFVNHEIRKSVPSIRVMLPENRWVPPLQKAVGLYNQDAEKVKLEVEVLGRPQLRNKILSAVGKGVAPDLALVDWAWVTEFADLRFLKSLDRLDSHWLEEFKADLFPAFRTNTFYGVQPEASVSVLWYRKDWFLQEGAQPPRTWNELIEVSRHFKRLKRFPLAFVGSTKAGRQLHISCFPLFGQLVEIFCLRIGWHWTRKLYMPCNFLWILFISTKWFLQRLSRLRGTSLPGFSHKEMWHLLLGEVMRKL